MSSRTGSIRERGGRWEARWYDPDGNRRSKRFGSGAAGKRMAQEFATQQQLDARRAREGRGTYLEPARKVPTFKEAALAWLETSPGTAPKTRIGYASIVHVILLPEFGSTRIDKISPTDLKRFAARQQKAGKAPGTIKSYMRVLSPIFEQAIDDEVLVRNPVKRVRLKAPASRRATIVTPSQVKLLASLIDSHYRGLVLFDAFTGLRAGEIAALRWRHVDVERLSVTVAESVSRISVGEGKRAQIDLGTEDKAHFKGTKSNRSRSIRFPSFLVPLLGEPRGRDDFVFTTAAGAPLRFDNFRTNRWLPAVKAASEADTSFPATLRFHDLRHTCASVLIDAGYNPKKVQVHMGHSSITVTMDTYGHLFDDAFDDLPEVLDSIHRDAPELAVIEGVRQSA